MVTAPPLLPSAAPSPPAPGLLPNKSRYPPIVGEFQPLPHDAQSLLETEMRYGAQLFAPGLLNNLVLHPLPFCVLQGLLLFPAYLGIGQYLVLVDFPRCCLRPLPAVRI